MAKKENQKPVLLTLNGVEYDVNKDFNDEQKRMYLHLKNIDEKINSNNFIQEQLSVNKEAFIKLLQDSLKKDDSEEWLLDVPMTMM